MSPFEATLALGLLEDARDYTAAAQMLTALGITELNLPTNDPDKARQLDDLGISVARTVPTGVHTTPSDLRYLHAKVQHTHHTVALAPVPSLAG